MNFLITAGPTREWIDPVRFISNPSSGKMGYAVAEAAQKAGARVTLVSGPTSLAAPDGVELVRVETADEMAEAVAARAAKADVVVMAAAVGDWTPARPARHKIKKLQSGIGKSEMVLRLKPTVDIAAALGRRKRAGQVVIGFAAETERLEKNAREKLARKNFDLIVANDVTKAGSGFAVDTNEIILIDSGGGIERPRRASKRALAELIVKRALALHEQRRPR